MTALYCILLLLAFLAFAYSAFRDHGLVAAGLALWVLVVLIQTAQRL